MKVSVNLAQDYSNVDLKGIGKDALVASVGAQLGAVEEVIDWAPKFDGVVLVRVVECEKHPNADKLHVCKIDDGQAVKHAERDKDGYVQVVCGAPNVKKDMFVAWIPPRTTVPSTKGTSDEFVLEARELRGVISNGMLASAHELGINDDHSGLLEITADNAGKNPVPGEALTAYFGLDDVVIDCENKMFTHRPDCFGNLGVARELAGINGLNFKSPDWYVNAAELKVESNLPFESKNEITNLVPRFMAQVVEGVEVASSNLKMQVDLARVGLRALNNIVDFTNYYMHLTGQPTHAFDYDKIKALSSGTPTIFPRMAKDGEELTLLNGKTVKLTKDDIVIATDKKAVALAGVMGGAETEVDDSTKNIIIECATFDMYAIRRTSMRHGIFSDAVTRFNKGQSPWQNDKVLSRLVGQIISDCGAIVGKLIDIKSKNLTEQNPVNLNVDFISKRLGRKFTADEAADLLSRTELEVTLSGDDMTVKPPFWRMDIECPEDVVEEVGRLYGFSNLPVELPSRKSVALSRNKALSLKRELASILKSFGANEVLTYSFVHGDLIKSANQNVDNAYQIRNAISPDLQYYRLSLSPSIAQHVLPNIKAGYGEFALFEIGKIHSKSYGLNDEKVPVEKEVLAFTYSGSDKVSKSRNYAPYFTAEHYLRLLMSKFNINFELKADLDIDKDISAVFANDRSALVVDTNSGDVMGIVGEYSQELKTKLKIPKYSAGFELFVDALLERQNTINYSAPSKFPSSEQDMTFEVAVGTNYSDIKANIKNAVNLLTGRDGYKILTTPLGIYADNVSKKRVTFRFRISHPAKTLKNEEINSLTDTIAENLATTIGAERI